MIRLAPDGMSPRGPRFARPARFDHQHDDWLEDAWSLVVEVEGKPDFGNWQTAKARFLSDEAPTAWLEVGKRFAMYEGDLVIAEGEVVANSS